MQESIEPTAEAAAESDMPAVLDDAGELGLAERIVASVGAWFGGLLLRCAPPSGPFFTSDGRLAAYGATIATPPMS